MNKKRKMSEKTIFKKNGTSYPVDVKQKVIGDIKSGLLSNRAAAKLYGLSRNTINNWIVQDSLLPLYNEPDKPLEMNTKEESSRLNMLSKQVVRLQKALEKANLKIDGLETMINLSEKKFKIKIRKKSGAKRFKE